MNELFLNNGVLTLLFIDFLILIVNSFVVFIALKIILKWDINSYKNSQYRLEKSSYLAVVIIFFSFIIKIFMLPYFTYILDDISNLLSGAMCAAGVINENIYGKYSLILKFVIILLCGIWIILNKIDTNTTDYKYIKKKFSLFVLIFIIMLFEFFSEFRFFSLIDTQKLATCCSSIFSKEYLYLKLPFNLGLNQLIMIFYLIYLLNIFLSIIKNSFLFFISNILFSYIAYFCVVYLFGTYIYELPTHHCPFCMLQNEYNFVGYLLWGSLGLGTFFGISGFVLELSLNKKISYMYMYSIIFNTIFVVLSSSYILIYYLKNGVFL